MNRGKTDLFVFMIEQHKGIVYKIANAYCRNAEDRKDVIQEIMVQLWKSFDNYSAQYKYSTWIYRIALNVAISFYQRQNRRSNVFNPLPDYILDFAEQKAPEDLEKDISSLHQFLSELKELDKALMLLYLEENSYRQIAEIMGLSETNVATKIGRIKTILKQKFSRLNATDHGRS